MKHLKTYENIEFDVEKELEKGRKILEETKKNKKELSKIFIEKLADFTQTIYPEINVKVEDEKGYIYNRCNIHIKNIRKIIPERMSDSLDWLTIEIGNWDLTVHFPIRYNEISFLSDVNKYLMPIIKQYQTNNDHEWIFALEYKNIQKIIDEISIKDFEIHQHVNKYNL